MDFSEKWGQDVAEATNLALRDLKCTIDEVDVVVLEEPSKGFLGLGSKLAKVRVTKKSAAQPVAAPVKPREEEVLKMRGPLRVEAVDPSEKSTPPERQDRRDRDRDRREPRERREHREHREPRERREYREPREGFEQEASSPRPRRTTSVTRPDNMTPLESHPALDFLRETTQKMGLDLAISGEANEETLYFSIEGKDSGTIIGKRGQTLDAIQYLTSLVVNKEKEKYTRVIVDAENYRVKRERTLEQLADRLAGKVVKTRRPVRLEPMNPYERMVIHATLQDHPRVKTRSEGEEPYRRVIIELK